MLKVNSLNSTISWNIFVPIEFDGSNTSKKSCEDATKGWKSKSESAAGESAGGVCCRCWQQWQHDLTKKRSTIERQRLSVIKMD